LLLLQGQAVVVVAGTQVQQVLVAVLEAVEEVRVDQDLAPQDLVIHHQLHLVRVTRVAMEVRQTLLVVVVVQGATDRTHRVQQGAQGGLVLILLLPGLW